MTSLADWADFWKSLSPATLSRIGVLCAPDVHFIDPFNYIIGTDRLEALLKHMFRTMDNPRFVVEDQAMGAKLGYLRWRFSAAGAGKQLTLDGMSEVGFAADGRISLHRDHWDAGAQVYGRIPLLGTAIRLVRRRLSCPA